jgi:methionyl-tRNA formyltransferase
MADGNLLVGCDNGSLRLQDIQLEGSRRMKTEEFLRGRK